MIEQERSPRERAAAARNRRSAPIRFLWWAACVGLATWASAGSTPQADERWMRTVPVATRPPVIDGWLRPGEWNGATTIEDLLQVEPNEGGPPSGHTVVYLAVDRDNLYVGLDCRQPPEEVIRTQVTRDANLDPDDRVELIFDTFLDRRNAYFFQIGPGGSKGDALIAGNGSFFSKDWDGIWEGRARVTDTGWTAELALPAKTLSRKVGLDTWGFNARRHLKHRNEEAQWAHPDRQNRLFHVSSAGLISGMAVLERGLDLDLTPYLSFAAQRRHEEGDHGETFELGADLRWKVTPSLSATLTANTDFAETEVDSRVVNLSRFPVFFPEKRDFFLEDSGIFSFGPFDGRRRNDLLPFFSRRIGLSEGGQPVPILGGGKLTGRAGRWSLGLLDVVTDAAGALDARNLAAVRASVNLLEQSQLGLIFTAGDPATGGENALAGLDATYRTTRFRGDRTLRADVWVLGTVDRPAADDGSGRQRGHAFGFLLQYPNDFVEAELGWQEISDDFRPDLGFVRRRGVRVLSGSLKLQPRPASGLVRRFGFGMRPELYTTLADGELETGSVDLTLLEVLFDSGDRVELGLTPGEERLVAPFEIVEGVVVSQGRYRFTRWSATFASADKRPISGRIELSGGGFFSGSRDDVELGLAVRLLHGLAVELDAARNDVDLREGRFTTHLARLRVIADFGPDVSWINFVQWDDESEELGWNSRLRWIVQPGRDIFLVVNRAFDRTDSLGRPRSLAPATTDVTLKVSYTLRF